MRGRAKRLRRSRVRVCGNGLCRRLRRRNRRRRGRNLRRSRRRTHATVVRAAPVLCLELRSVVRVMTRVHRARRLAASGFVGGAAGGQRRERQQQSANHECNRDQSACRRRNGALVVHGQYRGLTAGRHSTLLELGRPGSVPSKQSRLAFFGGLAGSWSISGLSPYALGSSTVLSPASALAWITVNPLAARFRQVKVGLLTRQPREDFPGCVA